MLSDHQIRQAVHWGNLRISGFTPDHLQPSSYDVHLHEKLLVLRSGTEPIDVKVDTADQWDAVTIGDGGYVLRPGEFALGSTFQRFEIGSRMVGTVEGKSSLGRLGLLVHATAGFIDPGFTGQITLELSCVQARGIKLYPGMPIAQIAFDDCRGVEQLYRGKYVDQHGPTASRYHLNWVGDGWK